MNPSKRDMRVVGYFAYFDSRSRIRAGKIHVMREENPAMTLCGLKPRGQFQLVCSSMIEGWVTCEHCERELRKEKNESNH